MRSTSNQGLPVESALFSPGNCEEVLGLGVFVGDVGACYGRSVGMPSVIEPRWLDIPWEIEIWSMAVSVRGSIKGDIERGLVWLCCAVSPQIASRLQVGGRVYPVV